MKDTIKRLKQEIKDDAALCRKQRDEARQKLAHGRSMLSTDRPTAMDLIEDAVDERQSAGDGRQRERLLAYGYLRNRTYKRIENHCREYPYVGNIGLFLPSGHNDITLLQEWLRQGTVTREEILDSVENQAA